MIPPIVCQIKELTRAIRRLTLLPFFPFTRRIQNERTICRWGAVNGRSFFYECAHYVITRGLCRIGFIKKSRRIAQAVEQT